MKLNKKSLHLQRRQLDEKLKAWIPVSRTPRPRLGWLKAVREALGLSTRQLATFLGTDNAGVLRLEKRECQGKASLESLDRAAKAMGCKIVYAVVPDESLEGIVDQKAKEAARSILRSVSHSMRLEKQEVSPEALENQIQELASELKARLDPALWEKRS
ncbi:MAG: mobile mystery protein A [Bdellovibrionales bacterium]|nr:mobile mystery protein A [Bdellovibrionales bacterium]